MKKLLVILCGLTLFACGREPIYFGVKFPYRSRWIVINNTGQDIVFHQERVYYLEHLQKNSTELHDIPLKQHQELWQDFHDDVSGSKDVFMGFFTRPSLLLVSSRDYITLSGSDEVVKEWVMGVDNGEHDFYDESQWDHRSWEEETSYTIYRNEWTFTVTDADLGL